MFRKEVSPIQMGVWVLCAMVGPMCLLAGHISWLMAISVGLLCLVLCFVMWTVPQKDLCKAFCVIEYMGAVLVLGYFARWSADLWPTGRGYPTVPLTMLFIAVFAALNGTQGAARISCVLAYLLILLYSIVLAAGLEQIDGKHLHTENTAIPMAAVAVLLLPAGVWLLPVKAKGISKTFLIGAGVLFAALCVWTSGILTEAAAAKLKWPFYEATKSLSFLGIAERFEALVSVASTMSFFALYSYLLSIAGAMTERIRSRWGKGGIITAAAAAGAIMPFAHKLRIAVVLTAILLWGIIPLTSHFNKVTKKYKKDKKSA